MNNIPKMWQPPGYEYYYIAERDGEYWMLPIRPNGPEAWRRAKPYKGPDPVEAEFDRVPWWIAEDYRPTNIIFV